MIPCGQRVPDGMASKVRIERQIGRRMRSSGGRVCVVRGHSEPGLGLGGRLRADANRSAARLLRRSRDLGGQETRLRPGHPPPERRRGRAGPARAGRDGRRHPQPGSGGARRPAPAGAGGSACRRRPQRQRGGVAGGGGRDGAGRHPDHQSVCDLTSAHRCRRRRLLLPHDPRRHGPGARAGAGDAGARLRQRGPDLPRRPLRARAGGDLRGRMAWDAAGCPGRR